MTRFFVDPDIRKAKTIAKSFYLDDSVFEISRRVIFERSWQFAGMLDGKDTLVPFELLPGFLAQPLLIIQSQGEQKCFSNVCTHRGKVLVEAPCNASLIRCGYHGRRFGLDGTMLSMPEFEGVEDFPSGSDNLTEVSCSTECGFTFVSIDPAEPFETGLSLLADAVGISIDALRLASRKNYEIEAHWALYCENYLEGFHIPFVHHALNEIVDYGTYSTETFRRTSVQTGFDRAGNVEAKYLFIFPNTMLNFYKWGVSVNVVRPVSKARSVVEYYTYVADESKMDKGAGGDLHSIELEDEAVVESVQKGIRSRFYERGRYSPTREQGTHHFHRLIAEFVG